MRRRRYIQPSDLEQTQQAVQVLQARVGSGGSGASDHGALTGLADDDHTQYLNNTRGDARYALLAAPADAVTAHEAASNPHPVYLTQAEADALYEPVGGGLTAPQVLSLVSIRF
jgi:hypothetical protein